MVTELTDLLSILTQLVDLEDQMSDLLTDVLANPLLTRAQLATDGTAWPTAESDHQARITPTETLFDVDTGASDGGEDE